MRNIKYLIFTLFLFSLSFLDVSAAVCDSNDIARLKELAKNVTVTYEYDRESSELGSLGLYLVTVSGLTEELYGMVSLGADQKGFFYTEDNQGIDVERLSNGDNELIIYSSNCSEIVRTIKVKLPYYNDFSNYGECNGISGEDLYVCSDFLDKPISYSIFENEIRKYKEGLLEEKEESTIDIQYFFGAIICVFVICLIFLIVRKVKTNKLD